MKILNLFLSAVLAVLFASCDSDVRMLKKFASRLNAGEYSCASVYLYEGDLPNFSFFINEVRKGNSNLMIKLTDGEKIGEEGNEAIVADFQLINPSKQILNYFNNIGYEIKNNTFRDTIKIRQTADGDKLSFNWGLKSSDENHYRLAYLTGDNVQEINIRTRPSTSGKIIGKLSKGRDILIDNSDDNGNWKHCYMVDKDGNVIDGYVIDTNLSVQKSSFFDLNLFDSMTLTVAIVILVVIVVFFVFGSSIFMMFSAIPGVGIVVIIGSILGLLYTVYQLLEKILFELFIINLPY